MNESELLELRVSKRKLNSAVEAQRSVRWCLTLWSRFIKQRDAYECVLCGSKKDIQAHHLFRRTLYPHGWFTLGNGITLCWQCHRIPHAKFNGRPDFSQPIDAQGGDDQDEIAAMYQMLLRDAEAREIPQDEFYFIEDRMLQFFVKVQGYEHLLGLVQEGRLSRLRMAYAIWRDMPEIVYKKLFSAVLLGRG